MKRASAKNPRAGGKRKIRVAFQGERGAFSEEAARRILGHDIEPCPKREFDDMFDSVIRDEADCAVVPIENTLAGSVIKNYDLLADNDLEIIGEVILRVAHNLIAPKGTRLESLRKVYSHPVALAQCEDYLRKLRLRIAGLEVLPHYDTAGSVKLVVESRRRDEAAIASRAAAETYGAQILAEGIESNPQNFTRFFVMARPDRRGSVPLRTRSRDIKTSIVFRTANKPGALYHALEAFAKGKIDLTKIESRPIVGRPWEYSFYLDFMGDRNAPAARRALASLTMVAESLRIFGSYPRAE
ncbi:MAG: prephenate dehydratase [Deltaproteobacteria bacterium]|nr:prephenate dehydratase [Deltaproteobacteria bacterium]